MVMISEANIVKVKPNILQLRRSSESNILSCSVTESKFILIPELYWKTQGLMPNL